MTLRGTIAKQFTAYTASFIFMQLLTVGVPVFIRNAFGPDQLQVTGVN